MTERCEGGYFSVDQIAKPYSPGWYKGRCPTCERRIAFHWATGRFKAHNRPAAGVSAQQVEEIREGEG